jgi:putative two-component system protein, hydrogenase maturation factor HypX/HoxX
MQSARMFRGLSLRHRLHRVLSTLSLSPSPTPSQCYRVLLLGAHDSAAAQAIRLRLAHDDGVRVALEFASSSTGLSAAIGAHKPHVIVCMDHHAARLLPESVVRDTAHPCLSLLTSPSSDVLHVVEVQSPLSADTTCVTGRLLSSVDVPQLPGLSRSWWLKSTVDPAFTSSVVDAVRKSRHGMPMSPSEQCITGNLFRRDDPRLHDVLGDVEFAASAHCVAARIAATDSSPGTPWIIDGHRVLLYGAHVDVSPLSERSHGHPGSIIGQRHGAVAIQCGAGVVWVSHMKSATGDTAVKLPSTSVLPHSILRAVPVLPDPPVILPPSQSTPSTFQDVWATVDANVATLRFPLYNGVMRLDQAQRVREAFVALTRRDDVAVIVLSGGGSFAFHNGMDFNSIHASVNPFGTAWATMNAMNDLVRDMLTCTSKVVISAISGSASAGGVMSSLASDLVWTHGDVVFNPHYKAMGVHGSDYWTYTLPKRVGAHAATDITNSMQPLSARDALSVGIVDSIVSQSGDEFARIAAEEACKIAGDAYLLRAMLDRKQANVSGESLEAMHRARLYESVVMRDNLRDPGHVKLRGQLVEKTVPLSTPLYISGQSSTFGRVLDGKSLAQLKLQHMKRQVAGFKDTLQQTPTLGLLLVGDQTQESTCSTKSKRVRTWASNPWLKPFPWRM